MNKNLRITVRVEDPDRERIEALVEAGRFRNLSSVVREALSEFLSDKV